MYIDLFISQDGENYDNLEIQILSNVTSSVLGSYVVYLYLLLLWLLVNL